MPTGTTNPALKRIRPRVLTFALPVRRPVKRASERLPRHRVSCAMTPILAPARSARSPKQISAWPFSQVVIPQHVVVVRVRSGRNHFRSQSSRTFYVSFNSCILTRCFSLLAAIDHDLRCVLSDAMLLFVVSLTIFRLADTIWRSQTKLPTDKEPSEAGNFYPNQAEFLTAE